MATLPLPLPVLLRRGLSAAFWMLAIVPFGTAAEPSVATRAGGKLELAGATLVLPSGMTGPEKKAAQMLVEEVAKRGQISWPTSDRLPGEGKPAVVLGQRAALMQAFPSLAAELRGGKSTASEGYQILSVAPGTVVVAGNDARGVLFGAGRLLRLLDYGRETVTLPTEVNLTTAPRYPLRGHQLGYRPKTNAYDAWSAPMWEQYVRDLVIFGANAIEGIPPRSDDAADSPHFPLSPIKMMIEQSRIAQEYGIEYWVWYPAMDKDYGNPATVEVALKEWGEVLRQLPYVTAVFVPGGDPGHTSPKNLFPMLEKQTAQLQKLHPGAKMWMSPQSFNREWMDDFYKIMDTQPAWLEGVIFAPQQLGTIEEVRARVPKRYKMRYYPDITHSLASQYPVQDWDFSYAATLNREPINPRPIDEAAIFHRLQPFAECGVITYSEGCNDDVNKCIWSSLAWDPDTDIHSIVRDYAHYFIGSPQGEGFAQGLFALERNWRGPLVSNEGVYTTLEQFQELEHNASPATLQNWRFQEGLYRAYYDATVRARLLAETAQENRALDQLRRAHAIGSQTALAAAKAELEVPALRPALEWRARVFELAEALFQSIHMQLSVIKYKAIAIRRGANLDLIDYPLSNAPWLKAEFAEIEAIPDEMDRLRRIDEILSWTNPGPGGFYDDLGNTAARPHLVLGSSYADDPTFLKAPMVGFAPRTRPPFARVSSSRFAETLGDFPLEMHYSNLDKNAHYKVRIMYGSETVSQIRLVANQKFEIQPMQLKPIGARPVEFDIPAEATASGDLRLTWTKPFGGGGTGRGVQVAEVWLVRKPLPGEIPPPRRVRRRN